MQSIEGTIQPRGAITVVRSRVMVAVLVAGLVAGFGLGRAGNGSVAGPSRPIPTIQGPGHVPRVWVGQP